MAPFATIGKALECVRQKKDNGEGILSILLMGGDYKVSETVTLTAADSGTEDQPLIIEAADPLDMPRLTGGIDIPFSALSSAPSSVKERITDTEARDKIMAADLSALGIADYGEITLRGYGISEEKNAQMTASVDGADMHLARWPNEEWITITDDNVANAMDRKKENMSKAASSFQYCGTRPESWQEPQNAWVSGSLGYNYFYDYYPISTIDKNTRTVELKQGAIVTRSIYPGKYSNHYFRYENILEELDAPGEYFIDRANGMFYMYPPESSDENSTLTLSCLDADMFRLENVSNVKIRGLELHSGRGSAIRTAQSGSRIIIEECKIHSFGRRGAWLSNVTGCAVRNCEIFDIGETAVEIRGGDYDNIISGGNIVEGNHLYRFAQLDRSYKAGILVGDKSVGTVVQDNYIHDAPHWGIAFYGVNNLFKNNVIERVVTEFIDSDAMYVNNYVYPWERGNVIESNYFNNIGTKTFVLTDGNGNTSYAQQINVAAIRTDNAGHGLNIYHNVFHNIGLGNTNAVSAVRAQGTYNRIWENLFVDCSEAYNSNTKYDPQKTYPVTDKNYTDERFTKVINPDSEYYDPSCEDYKDYMTYISRVKGLINYLPVYSKVFPELVRFWEEHPQAVRTNEFKNNIIVNMSVPFKDQNGEQNAEGFRGAPELVDASGNLVTKSNPGFTSYEDGDFSVLKNSDAYNTVQGNTDFAITCKGKK